MQTALLIARLARHAGPVQVLPTPRTLLLRWAVVAVVTIVAGIAWYGIRGDAGTRLASPDFLVRALLTTALATVAARHAWSWGVPGAEPEGLRRFGPQVVLAVWTGMLVWLLGPALVERIVAVRWHPQCAWQLATIAAVPAAWMYSQLRRAAPYALGWTSVQVAMASAAAGALAVQWICGLDGAAHQLAWHVGPLLAVSGATALMGRLVLRQH